MFRVLRKYTKAILAVSFVFLMFAFVAGPVLNNWISGNAPASAGNLRNRSTVVMTWEGGKLTAGGLQARISRKLSLNRILQTIYQEGHEASLDAGIAKPTLTVTPFHSNGTSEARIVQNIAFAEMAKAQGMRITDEDIKTYLFNLGFKRVSFNRIQEILTLLRVEGRTATADFLFEAIRDEMLAHNYWVSYLAAGINQLPQERWNNWRQFNDRIVLEAVAIQPDDYLSEVGEPTEKQLLDFYEKYKNSDGRPEKDSNKPLPSSSPTFADPIKVKLVSLKVDFETLRTEAAAKISDKEVKEYYEKHKDQMFLAVDLSSSLLEEETVEETTKADETTDDDTKTNETKTDETTATSTENESSDKEDIKETIEENEAATTENESSDKEDVKETTEETEAATTETEKTEEAAKTDDTAKEASISSSPFRLVAFEQEEDKKEDAAVKEETKAGDDVKTEKDSSVKETTEEEAAKTDNATTEEAADDTKTDDTTAEPTEKGSSDKDSPDYVAPKYQPLSEVEKDIRSLLSYEPATQKLEQKISAAYAELKEIFEKYDLEKIDAEDAGKKEPALPETLANLQAFAEKHDLTLEQHEPLSPWDLQKTEVGQLFEVERFRQPISRVIFVKELFLDYEPLLAGRTNGFEPLKTEIVIRQKLTPAQPRPFAEIKELVTAAWKQDQAATKAFEFATKIASKVTENEATILESLPEDGNDYEIFESLPFSLYQINPVGSNGRPQIELASPDPIIAANYNFILTATNLKKKESKALLNHDKSVAYVLRIKSHTQTPEELRNGFLLESNYWTGAELSFQKSRYQHATLLYQYVREQLNVKELRSFENSQIQR